MKILIVMLCFCCCLFSGCTRKSDVILQNSVAEQEDSVLTGVNHEDFSQMTSATLEDGSDQELSSENPAVKENESENLICVYICGAVLIPGVYEIPEDSRIYQVVELAGGLTDDADRRSVNLAETVLDGQMIWIPTKSELEAGEIISVPQTGGVSAGNQKSEKINLNTATIEELMSLNGIGQTKAEAIVAYREAHGSFHSVDEILQVNGIGQGTFEKIQEHIRVQ